MPSGLFMQVIGFIAKEIVGDIFQALSMLLCLPAHKTGNGKGFYVKKNRSIKAANALSVEWYSGKVWCPTTGSGFWVMRRSGKVIITGNSRRNFPQTIKTMLNDPKQYAIQVKILDKMSNRENLTDEELGLINEWESETFKIFGDVIDGVREFKTLGFFPVEEAYQTLNAITSSDAKKLSGRLSPLASTFLDFKYGKDAFYGKDFGNYLAPRYTKFIPKELYEPLGLTPRMRPKYRGGEIVGQEEVLYGDPDTIFLIRRFPLTSRFLGDLATAIDTAFAKGKPGAAIRGYLTGIKDRELDVKARAKGKSFREKEELTKASKKKGSGEFSGPYIPAWQKEKLTPKEKRMQRRRELRERLGRQER